MIQPQQQKKGWFDTSISLQKVLAALLTAVFACVISVGTWAYGIDKRVTATETQDQEQEKHFSRIEGALAEQKTDTRDQLRNISQDIKDLSGKFDQLKDQMFANSVASRPEVGRWSKP